MVTDATGLGGKPRHLSFHILQLLPGQRGHPPETQEKCCNIIIDIIICNKQLSNQVLWTDSSLLNCFVLSQRLLESEEGRDLTLLDLPELLSSFRINYSLQRN